MRKLAFICGALLVAATLSCTREQDFAPSGKMVFQATWADNPDTRTAIQSDGTSVWWSPNEEISIFTENSYGKFTSTNTEPQATVTFEGTLSDYGGRSVTKYWAVYPYEPGNDYYNGRLYLNVKSSQQGKEGTFADKAFPAVGVSDNQSIAFYHVCGGARFIVANEGIESVTFESLGGEPMAGYVTVSFEEGRPVAEPLSYGVSTAVTVFAPEGGFVPGKYYFAAFLPGTLSKGLNVTYSKSDGTFAEIALDKPITVRRARFGTIDRKDEGLTFKGYEVTAPTAVDLGLSVKWASFNIGATKPTEAGYFYAWGETEPKKVYDMQSYQWSDLEGNLTKYNFDAELGTVDNKIQLDEDDDVAQVKLGEKWRMPTNSEFLELENTQYDSDYQWSFKSVDGVDGVEVVYLRNGNSIFFPATGAISGATAYYQRQVCFWSRTVNGTYPNNALCYFISVNEDFWGYSGYMSRDYGMAVRPVYGDLPPDILVESIILERQQVILAPDVYFYLNAAVLPEDATNKGLRWSSDNESVATVDSRGYIYGVAPGTATITAASMDGSTSVTCQVVVKNPETTFTTPTAVDLGLSVQWASFNIGATKPEESGNYYAWGETEPKTGFDYDNYKWYDLASRSFTKYNFDSEFGTIDNKFQLDAEDDVARVKLGGKWRMPTAAEMQELLDTRDDSGYQWQYKSVNGIPGYEIVCLANGNKIFLPFSGDISYDELSRNASYWTTSLTENYADNAEYGSIYSYDSFSPDIYYYSGLRYRSRVSGLPVRPVYGDLNVIPVESVSLNRTKLDLPVGVNDLYLRATVLPENASTKKILWTSSDESVVTVSPYGEISALAPGSATITVMAVDGGLTATCQITVKDPAAAFATPAAVDLGLSVKWASFNVGATKPEENGFYYAWGETEPKPTYDEDNYRWCDGDMEHLTKYNFDSTAGLVDNKSKLEDADDVAHVKLGGKWRMPTYEEIQELRNTEDDSNYQWTWKMLEGGCYGLEIVYLVNGNKIFLPASGAINRYGNLYELDEYGVYWASSCPNNYLRLGQSFNLYAYDGYFSSYVGTNYRATGYSVRPVYGNPPATIPIESISLDREKVLIPQNVSVELSATILPENTTDITVWTSSDATVAAVDASGKVTAVAPGTATITIQTLDGKKKASCQVTVQASATTFATPTAVDLGLSVKWGSFNLGATAPDQTGNYYAWGETEPKPFHLDSYKWYYNEDWSVAGFTKYCNDPEEGYNGFTDGKTQLDPEDDVVRVKLGGKWRMPTSDEFQELIERCTWTWAVQNGLGGYQVKGPNGKSIFLPAAGYLNGYYLYNYDYKGYYFSSQLWEDSIFFARALEFGSWDDGSYYYYITYMFRQNAATIRPVRD